MSPKHDIINKVMKEVGAKTYLEIGYDKGINFAKIICNNKKAVDPALKQSTDSLIKATSDEFFEVQESDIDVVFVDGLHHADQVRKDITNAMKFNAKAVIIHDTLPWNKDMQIVPRQQKQWTGDVWRAVVGFVESYPDVRFETYKADYGLTVIYPEGKKVRKHFENMDMAWEEFNPAMINTVHE